jgi:mRNA interferase YafQ
VALRDAVDLLASGEPLPSAYADHALAGRWGGRRDCHIEPDWLLNYRWHGDTVVLVRTGTHGDLF